jgi:DNA-binding MarR family transcriptional regulator
MTTSERIGQRAAGLLRSYDLSPVQYNVLRILRGAGDAGASATQIGERLISRDPDVTRMMDRLEKRGLLRRARDARDRRVVIHRLTEEGLMLLAQLDEPVDRVNMDIMRGLRNEEMEALISLLERVRTGDILASS